MWRLLPVLLAALCSPLCAHAQAALRRAALHWVRGVGAEHCIDPRTLASRVEALTGPVLASPTNADVSIEGEVTPRASGGFHVRITVTDRIGGVQGERAFDQAVTDCRALDASIAFVIAITIDPALAIPDEVVGSFTTEVPAEELLLGELETEPPVPAPVESPKAPAAPEPATTSVPEPPSPPSRPWELSGALGVAFRAAPSIAPGIMLSVLRSGAKYVSLGVAVRALPPLVSEHVEASRRVAVQSYDLAPLLCGGGHLTARLLARGCISPELTLFVARGYGFDTERRSVLAGLGTSITPQLRIALRGRFSLRLEAPVRVNWIGGRFAYSTPQVGEKTAFRVPRIGAAVWIGPAIEF